MTDEITRAKETMGIEDADLTDPVVPETEAEPVKEKPEPEIKVEPEKSDIEKQLDELRRENELLKERDAVQRDLLKSASRKPQSEDESNEKDDRTPVSYYDKQIEEKLSTYDSLIRDATKIRIEANETGEYAKLNEAADLELKAKRIDLEISDLKIARVSAESELKTSAKTSEQRIQQEIVKITTQYADLMYKENPEFTTEVDGKRVADEALTEFIVKAEEEVVMDLKEQGYINDNTNVADFLLNPNIRKAIAGRVKSNPILKVYLNSKGIAVEDKVKPTVPFAETGGIKSPSPGGKKDKSMLEAFGFSEDEANQNY